MSIVSVESQTTKKFFLARKFAETTKHTETLYTAKEKRKKVPKPFVLPLQIFRPIQK